MELILEGLFYLVFELFGELLIELCLFAGVDLFRPLWSPLLSAIGYALVGALLGGLSSFVLPELLVRDAALRLVYLVVSPVVAGFAMAGLGALRAHGGGPLVRLDTFAGGALFAASFVIVRLVLCG